MYYNPDPYDTGIPKYSTAASIYDGLCELAKTEEIGILSEIAPDVSYDRQDYYYSNLGYVLKEKFDALSGCGDKMWLLDLAVWQIDQGEIHDFVFEALNNPDMAKQLGFKQLFIQHMLFGNRIHYDEIAEEYESELRELNRFGSWEMTHAFLKVMAARGCPMHVTPYPNFCHALCEKARSLRLTKETQLIAECRALLTGYDDFMLGLRMNQALYEEQKNQYARQAARLQASYQEKLGQLYLIAGRMGITPESVKALLPALSLPEFTPDQDFLALMPSNLLFPKQAQDEDS
jgi:hypothetical protein